MGWADRGGGGGVIGFLIFHFSVSTEKGWLEDEAGCSGIVGSLRKQSLNGSLISLYGGARGARVKGGFLRLDV